MAGRDAAGIFDSGDIGDIDKRGKRGRPRGMATQTVYEALRDEILTLVAKPGQYLDESQLEKRFGVSRTPIREALIRLQSDRLVRFSANRGHFVEVVNIDDVPAIFEAMDLYQAAVFRLTASRHSPELLEELTRINESYYEAASARDHKTMTEMNHQFHMVIGRESGNTFLAEAYETVLNYSIRLTYLMFEKASHEPHHYEEYYTRVYNEHKEMIELIRTAQKDRLEEISKLHTRLFCDRVISFVSSREEFRSEPQNFFGK
ncbi:GntR family transcriptional regulator [Paracoccus onubensis]|uniref:GntR family transcriptional regulator n=1 Tax=Paracoccus onubensis TaxID=1675788 RepID=A0A418SY31_9RHOB|nr:GntR family transcriptional regulator [Paracoccus onubensis]RJE85846.1 GntR family transcriptional regulator [Paracoccus onubensis]